MRLNLSLGMMNAEGWRYLSVTFQVQSRLQRMEEMCIDQMVPGSSRGEQRVRHSRPYVKRISTKNSDALQGPGNPGGQYFSFITSTSWDINPLFSGELAPFLPVKLGGLNWSSRKRTLSGCLVESLDSGFAIDCQVSLGDVEGEMFLGALGEDGMGDPVVEMKGDMEVVEEKYWVHHWIQWSVQVSLGVLSCKII